MPLVGSHIFFGTMMFQVTFGRWANSKKVTCSLPGFSSPKKDFWVVLLKRFNRKFGNDSFSILSKTCDSKLSVFVTVMLSYGKTPHRLNDSVLSHPKNNGFLGRHVVCVSDTKLNPLKNNKFRFAEWKYPLSGIKILGKKHVTVFGFSQRPKLRSTITLPKK